MNLLLNTGKYTIRNYKPSDAQALAVIFGDAEVMKYVEPPYDLDKTKQFLKKYGTNDTPLAFALIYDKSKILIGHVIYHPFSHDHLEKEYGKGKVYELGFVIAKEFWRKGCATDVAKELIKYSLREGVSALALECDPQNTASICLAKSLGFVQYNELGNPNSKEELPVFVLPLA